MRRAARGQDGGMKKKIAAYLLGIFIIVQLAAKIDSDHENTISRSVSVEAKISEFKKGRQKQIQGDYDIDEVIHHAKALVGTPHLMGGYSSHGIDCSGLVMLAHSKAGVALPRSSHDQARYGTIISQKNKLQRGDLVFFHSTYKKANLVTHTGIYLGGNEFIHASSKRGVVISNLDSEYYRKHYLFATRLKKT
jgi:murein DD-endopeptidase / murein LD-carboxypeptidase